MVRVRVDIPLQEPGDSFQQSQAGTWITLRTPEPVSAGVSGMFSPGNAHLCCHFLEQIAFFFIMDLFLLWIYSSECILELGVAAAVIPSFHEVLMSRMGQMGVVEHTPGPAGMPRPAALRSREKKRELQAEKMWEKDPGVHCRGNKAACTQHPYLCRNTPAFTPMDFQQRPSSHWNWLKQQLGNVVQSHLGCPVVGTMPAADETVYLEYCPAWSEASSNKHPPTMLWFHEKPLKLCSLNIKILWISHVINYFHETRKTLHFFAKAQTLNFLCGFFFFPFLVQNYWSFFFFLAIFEVLGSSWHGWKTKKRKQIASLEMELGRHCKEEQFQ